MADYFNEGVEFDPEFADLDTDFEAEAELDAALNERSQRFRAEGLKERGRQAVSNAAERGRDTFYNAADRGRGRLADAIDSAADRIDDRLAYGATYLRTHDVDVIREDLSNSIRRHPLLSAGVALGAGYLIGRVFTDAIPNPRRRHRRRHEMGRQLRRAVVSSLGALAAARMRESMAERPSQSRTVDD